jgi:hypothetical protein
MKHSDPAFEALWKCVVDDWDDDATHGAFLEHCQHADLLHEAAVRYRGMTGDRERGQSAEKRLQGVALLAMARLESTRTGSTVESGRTAARVVLILFFLAASVALLLYAGR